MAKARKEISRQADEADDALDAAEAAVARAQEQLLRARTKARRLRKQLRFVSEREDDAYNRELASIEEVEKMAQEGGASSEVLLDFPEDEAVDIDALLAAPTTWGTITGYSPSSWVDLGVEDSSTGIALLPPVGESSG